MSFESIHAIYKKPSQLTIGELATRSVILMELQGIPVEHDVTTNNYKNFTFNEMGSKGRGQERRKQRRGQ